MFSDPYRGVTYFGMWAEETADSFGQRDALAVLQAAVKNCIEEDMRSPEVMAALAFLAASATRQGAFNSFRRGLDFQDPKARYTALLASFRGICRVLGG